MNYEEQGAWINAIVSLFPNVAFSLNENGLQDWDIDGAGVPRPTDQVIQDEVNRLQAVEDTKETARLSAIQKLATAAGLTADDTLKSTSVLALQSRTESEVCYCQLPFSLSS